MIKIREYYKFFVLIFYIFKIIQRYKKNKPDIFKGVPDYVILALSKAEISKPENYNLEKSVVIYNLKLKIFEKAKFELEKRRG